MPQLLVGSDGPLVAEADRLGIPTKVLLMPERMIQWGESGWLWSRSNSVTRMVTFVEGAVRTGWLGFGYLRRLRRFLFQSRPDVIHSNGLKCHLLTSHAAPYRCAVIWHVRDFLSHRPVMGHWLRRLTRRPPTLILANSHAVAEDIRALFPDVPIATLYNGINTDYFAPQPDDRCDLDALAKLSPAPRGIVRVGLVAAYARWKGHTLFLDAAARLVHSGITNCRFYIIGGPIYYTSGSQFSRTELHKCIINYGLNQYCGLVPFQTTTLPQVYRSLDVVVHASTRPEPFGRTIVEAMACGRAVIVSAAGGAAELFTHGVDAWGVRPGDVQELAEAMFRLSTDADLRRRLGQAARCTAVERFDRRLMGQRLLQLYRSLIPSAIDC
ncbi:MAG: glycosyltransferase family 4 protein [Thermogemmata sp.]|nr:glycosyltransferase family 4 protein [Thermogemmata sp.]